MNLSRCRVESGVLLRRLKAARGSPALLHFTFLLSRATAQQGAEGTENPYRFNPNFNPALAIIVVVLIFAAFLMGFLCIYARKCDGGRSLPSRASGDSTRFPSSGVVGLDRAVIGSFPTFLHSTVKDLKMGRADGGGSQLECAVCLTEFKDDDALRLLPRCDHAFHANCIDAWFASRTTCPVCRADLSLPEEGKVAAESSHWQPPAPQPPSQSLDNPVANAAESHSPTQVTIVIEWLSGGSGEEVRNSSSRTAVKFPRSHSTGHSLSQATRWPREEWEKYTPMLPEEVRGGRELQIGDVDRWVVSMEPPLLCRHGSVRTRAVTDVLTGE